MHPLVPAIANEKCYCGFETMWYQINTRNLDNGTKMERACFEKRLVKTCA